MGQVPRKEWIRGEILEQLEIGEETLREKDQYLLGINLGDIDSGSLRQQEYWLHTMKAAQIATKLSDATEGIG